MTTAERFRLRRPPGCEREGPKAKGKRSKRHSPSDRGGVTGCMATALRRHVLLGKLNSLLMSHAVIGGLL